MKLSIKGRFSIWFSILFSLVLGVVLVTVYSLFANFRQEEFRDRLEAKAISTVKLLLEVEEVDARLLKVIDSNSINRIYNEKTLIFNNNFSLIYSSIDDAPLRWSPNELRKLKQSGVIFRQEKDYEVLGLRYPYKGQDYFVLISAEDKYGNRKLSYLRILLLGAFTIGTVLVWSISFIVSKRALMPLDLLRNKIFSITDKNLSTRIDVRNPKDEIGTLEASFNAMLERIDTSYKKQKVFTANASHELRTPLARMVTQLENLMEKNRSQISIVTSLKEISNSAYQLSDLVSSLLILSKMEESLPDKVFPVVRLDELLFDVVRHCQSDDPHLKFSFELVSIESEPNLSFAGDPSLLSAVFSNVLKNASLYSNDGEVNCVLSSTLKALEFRFTNKGPNPLEDDLNRLFLPFERGSNSAKKPGSGLGLSIVKRILDYHGATVTYNVTSPQVNQVVIIFPKHS